MLLRGETGAGKTTFLDTIWLFRDGVVTLRIPQVESIEVRLSSLEPSDRFRLVVLENREAVGLYSMQAIEADLHAINAFVRSDRGRNTLVVWPVNTDDSAARLVTLGSAIGGTALFGLEDEVTIFNGPPRDEFVEIASRTVSALNESASLSALGISEDHAEELTTRADTIGAYLGLIRDALLVNEEGVRALLPIEHFRMWTLVIAGTETEGDVAALTRGGLAYVDIDRLLNSTGANVVRDLKEHPDQLGILGTMLDAKIIDLDMLTALAIARTYGDDHLHSLMRAKGMSTASDRQADERLNASELGLIMSGTALGTRRRGSKAGANTKAAFGGLADIARTNDVVLNRAIGRALVANGFVSAFETEKDLGTEYVVKSDLQVVRADQPIRLEAMWRTRAGRADIANYVLTKLNLYGKAIGLMG